MALFSNDTNKTPVKTTAPKQVPKAVNKMPEDGRLDGVLLAPWLSEKALIATENGVYVFKVPRDATKLEVIAAIEKIYKVKPRQVRMVHLPAKKVSMSTSRGVGVRSRRHKAYVYLKKGETIQFA